MTAPKKKTASKPKATPKKTAPTKTGATTGATKKAAIPVATDATPEFTKSMEWLDKEAREFRVGTEEYTHVVSDFNRKFGTQYNTKRVPPYVFQIILNRLKDSYNMK
jgi:predicted aconitase